MRNKQKVFIQEYVKDFNATQAALRAGYSPKTAYSIGHENLTKPDIAAAIKARLDESAMSADEVLHRLAEHARGDMGEFLDLNQPGALEKARQKGLTRLIKKIDLSAVKDDEPSVRVMKIELYDAQAALALLGKRHGLFVDRHDITTGGKPVEIPDERFDRALSTLADAIRESLPGADRQPDGAMAAAEQAAVDSPPEPGG